MFVVTSVSNRHNIISYHSPQAVDKRSHSYIPTMSQRASSQGDIICALSVSEPRCFGPFPKGNGQQKKNQEYIM